jgi:transposase InsO family protein
MPKDWRQKVLEENHNSPESGHFGFYKTLNRISENYYWPKMRYNISKFLANCQTCREQKPSQSAPAGLMSSHIVEKPWQVVCSDLVGELPRSTTGFKWVLCQVDLFSKFVILTPLRDATAKSVCAALEKSILTYGAPELYIQDNAQVYNSGQFKDLAKKHGVRLQYTPRYHPQANPTERVNRVFETVMRSHVSDNQKDWDKFLPQIAFAINSSVHETTRFTPNFLFFTRQLALYNQDKPRESNMNVIDPVAKYAERFPKLKAIHELVKQKMTEANRKNAHHYNLRHRPSNFKVGDKVMKRNFAISKKGEGFSAKLTKVFVGPFVLKEQKAMNMFTLVDDDDKIIGDFDTKDLKKF